MEREPGGGVRALKLRTGTDPVRAVGEKEKRCMPAYTSVNAAGRRKARHAGRRGKMTFKM